MEFIHHLENVIRLCLAGQFRGLSASEPGYMTPTPDTIFRSSAAVMSDGESGIVADAGEAEATIDAPTRSMAEIRFIAQILSVPQSEDKR